MNLGFGEGGVRVAALVEALRYKPEGRGLGPRWGRWGFFTDFLPHPLS
jgi:hypothetical protein